jgi:hypothetical protein
LEVSRSARAGQGDVKLKSKPVGFVKFYHTIKSQISSTKLQINLKSQYSMTKTFAKIAARREVKSGEPGMMLLGAMADGSFVWIFEFRSRAAQALPQRQRLRGVCAACWDLFEPALARLIWGNALFVSSIQFEGISTISLESVWARDLVFGAWNFHDFC